MGLSSGELGGLVAAFGGLALYRNYRIRNIGMSGMKPQKSSDRFFQRIRHNCARKRASERKWQRAVDEFKNDGEPPALMSAPGQKKESLWD
jgi:hypothetical protein